MIHRASLVYNVLSTGHYQSFATFLIIDRARLLAVSIMCRASGPHSVCVKDGLAVQGCIKCSTSGIVMPSNNHPLYMWARSGPCQRRVC